MDIFVPVNHFKTLFFYALGRAGYEDWGKRPGDDLDGPPSRIRKMNSSPSLNGGDDTHTAKVEHLPLYLI